MARTFILGCGGTGAKVVESLMMLMGAGALGGEEIVPLLIDFDTDNGNVHRCVQLMDMYAELHNKIYPDTEQHEENDSFFSAKLRTLSEFEAAEGIHKKGGSEWLLTVSDDRLKDLYFMDSLCRPNAANDGRNMNTLMESLYGRSVGYPDKRKLGVVSVEGNRSIARLKYGLLGIWDTLEFKFFMNVVSPYDRIVVVGSTFGNSGSTGMLELLRIFRDYPYLGGNVKKAFILLDPYFNCGGTNIQDIFTRKSDLFYAAYDGFNDVAKVTYEVTPNEGLSSWDYNEEDRNQRNPSTPSELMGAIAICHFIKHHPSRVGMMELSLMMGSREDMHHLIETSTDMGNCVKEISGGLGYFSMFSYCNKKNNFLDSFIKNRMRHRSFASSFESDDRLLDLIREFLNSYMMWWKEMTVVSEGRFRVFDFDAVNMNKFIVGRVMVSGLIGLLGSVYRSLYREVERNFLAIQGKLISPLERVLAAFRMAADQLTQRPFTQTSPDNSN